jgi:hypothetical protein
MSQMSPGQTPRQAKFTLVNVTTGGPKLPPRVMVYGVDGVGKSTWAAGSDSPIFIPTEDGASRVTMPDGQLVPQFPLCSDWQEVFDCLRSLAGEKHDYKTVVLDSADWAQTLANTYVVQTECGGDVNKFDDYGKGYKGLFREWCKLLQALDYLHKKRGMGVILIAHSTVRAVKNPNGPDYDKWESNLINSTNTSIWNKTKEWCEIVMFANFDIVIKPTEDRERAKGVMKKGDKARALYIAPSAAYDSKVRAGWTLPATLPLDYSTFDAALVGQEVSQ